MSFLFKTFLFTFVPLHVVTTLLNAEEPCLTLRCEDPWFSLLEKGIKPVEGRKGQLKYRKLQPGDTVRFQCVGSERSFLATVEKVDCFVSLMDYLKGVSLDKALPGIQDFEEGVRIYSQWSTPEEIEDLGFVGIWIKVED